MWGKSTKSWYQPFNLFDTNVMNWKAVSQFQVYSCKTLGVVGVVGVLVADATNFEGPKVPNFMRNPPFLKILCFRTKSDVHPVYTKSLSKKYVHNFEIFGKTYLTRFAQ